MKKAIIILILAGAVTHLKAQQLQTSSFYDMQGVLHNPSTVGTQAASFVGATYRTQWSGISGGPRTATVFGSFKMPSHKIGLGGYIYADKTGPTKRTGIQLAFAKHIPLKNEATFSLGLEARGVQFSLDRDKLSETLGSDPALGNTDTRFKFDAGFGVSYTGKKLQLGASVSQLVQSKLDFYNGNLTTSESSRLYRHYFFHGSYKWFPDANTSITPNFLVIYLPNAPTELQVGARVEHSEVFWWGAGYRVHQGFMLSAGLTLHKKFRFGYSFDIYDKPVSSFDGGSGAHELLLRYDFLR